MSLLPPLRGFQSPTSSTESERGSDPPSAFPGHYLSDRPRIDPDVAGDDAAGKTDKVTDGSVLRLLTHLRSSWQVPEPLPTSYLKTRGVAWGPPGAFS